MRKRLDALVVWVPVKANEAFVANKAKASAVSIWVADMLEDRRMKKSGFVSSLRPMDTNSNNQNEEINEPNGKSFGRK